MIAKLTYSNTIGEVAISDKGSDVVPNSPINDAITLPLDTATATTTNTALPTDTAAPLTMADLAAPTQNVEVVIKGSSTPDVIIARPMDVGVGGGFGGGGGGGAMPKPTAAATKKKMNYLWVLIPIVGYGIYKIAK